MYDKKIDELIEKYLKLIDNNEKYEKAIQERNERKKYYQSFDYDKIINMSDNQVIEYLGKLWSVMHIQKHKIYDKNGHDNFKKSLAELLYGKGPLKERYNKFHDNIVEFKISGMSEVLTYIYPDKCIIWNKKVKNVYKMIGFNNIPDDADNVDYDWYNELIQKGKIVQEKLSKALGRNVDLLDTDNFYEIIYTNSNKLNYRKIDKLLDDYYANSFVRIPQEIFKARDIKRFQDNWDINASNFSEMLEKAFNKSTPLLNAPYGFSYGMLSEFSAKEPETVRDMFKHLFDESEDLHKRILYFQEKSKKILIRYWDSDKNDFQTEHAISVYLSFMYPDKYYIYKPREDTAAIKALGENLIQKNSDNNKDKIKTLENFFYICDDIQEYILQDEKLLKEYDSYLTDDCYKNDNYHLLVSDILLYAGKKEDNDFEKVEFSNEIPSLDETMNKNIQEWIIPANPNYYDHAKSFEKNGFIDWIQNVNFNIGDIVYLYSSAPESKITAKTIVEKINLKKEEKVDDTEFYLASNLMEREKNNSRYVRLKLLKSINSDELKYNELAKHGLWGRPQSAARLPIELSKYINYVINGSTIEEDLSSSNIIYYGGPGCGKSKQVEDKYCKSDNYIRTTFYPDYTNSDFIGQLVPKYNKEKEKLEYVINPGCFTKALKKALENPDRNIYLIIEEINRGNAAAIFGDIFQLLDRTNGKSSYEISNNIIEEYLSLEKVTIPANLSIIATMNTSDQNVYTLDSAFKRRWKMVHVSNEFDSENEYDQRIGNKYVPMKKCNINWKNFISVINDCIVNISTYGIHSEDKQIGKYFVGESDLLDSNIEEYSNSSEALKSFSEKVLMYLWEDIAKLDQGRWFEENIKTFDDLLNNYRLNGIDVFSNEIKEKLKEKSDSSQE